MTFQERISVMQEYLTLIGKRRITMTTKDQSLKTCELCLAGPT